MQMSDSKAKLLSSNQEVVVFLLLHVVSYVFDLVVVYLLLHVVKCIRPGGCFSIFHVVKYVFVQVVVFFLLLHVVKCI